MRHAAIVAIFSFIAAPVFSQDALVTLFYSDENAEDLRYFITPTEDGSYNLAKKFTIAPDLDGYVRLKIKLKKPGFVYTSGLNRPLMIYVAPGKNVSVRITKSEWFGGDLRKENSFFNNYNGPRDSTVDHSSLQLELSKMPSASAFRNAVIAKIDENVDLLKLVARMKGRTVSPKIVQILSTTRALQILCKADSLIAGKLASMQYAGQVDNAHKDWKRLRNDFFVDSLINCGLSTSKDYSEYLLRYIDYVVALQSEDVVPDLAKYMQLTEAHLRGAAKEAYMSAFISSNILPGAPFYTRDLLLFYEKFKKDFPNSTAIPVLEPEMRRMAKAPTGAKK